MKHKAPKIDGVRPVRVRTHATGVRVLLRLGILVISLGGLVLGCGSDDPSGPCAACQPDQVCVQLNDSSTQCKSPVPTLGCRTVSAECRATITAAKSCSPASSACAAELCPSPYACMYSIPCGNESPSAQVYCYGP
jgi:hypothetical protein